MCSVAVLHVSFPFDDCTPDEHYSGINCKVCYASVNSTAVRFAVVEVAVVAVQRK